MLLGFKKRFAAPILAGTKVFTIRERRKVEPKIGERLYMYTGLRTKYCEKITDEHTLKSIQLVDIQIYQEADGSGCLSIRVDGRDLELEEDLSFFYRDGFETTKDFVEFWLKDQKPDSEGVRHIEAFDLVLHHWTDLKI